MVRVSYEYRTHTYPVQMCIRYRYFSMFGVHMLQRLWFLLILAQNWYWSIYEIATRKFVIVTWFCVVQFGWVIENIVTQLWDNSQCVLHTDMQKWHNDKKKSWHDSSWSELYIRPPSSRFWEIFKREKLGKSKEVTLGLSVISERFSWVDKHL